MTRSLPLILLAACTYVPPPGARDVDADADGILAVDDCNDGTKQVARLDPVAVLHCGDQIEGSFETDRYDVFNCVEPTRSNRLIKLEGDDVTWRFATDQPSAVRIRAEGGGISDGHWILANVGPWCNVDTCVLGQRAIDMVEFYAEANEPWYVVLSQGDATWDYTLYVDCDGEL